MWSGQTECPDALALSFAILGAIGDEAIRTVPLLTIGFNSDAPIQEHVEVSGAAYEKLSLNSISRANEADPAERFEARLCPAVDQVEHLPQAVRGTEEKFIEVVPCDELFVERGLQAGERVDIVETRQSLQHGIKR